MAEQKLPVRCGFRRVLYTVQIGDIKFRLENRIVEVGTAPEDFIPWMGFGQIDEDLGFGNVKGQIPFALPGVETFEDAMGMALAAFNKVKEEAVGQARRDALAGGGQPPPRIATG